ncbi:MAG: hypothetical protein AAF791_12020 [Bacteroidota bacterium]
MPSRNRIPRHRRGGARDYRKLTAHERTVLMVMHRDRDRAFTVGALLNATRLSRTQLDAALSDLASEQRCAPLGALALRRDTDAKGRATYALTTTWKVLKLRPKPAHAA